MESDHAAMPAARLRIYDPAFSEQLRTSTSADARPVGDPAVVAAAAAATHRAVVYGLPAVFQYASMCSDCAPAEIGLPWSTNVFRHERETATASFDQFRVPNVDTVYSNGWLDLTDGPVTIDLPDFGSRYYTLEFLDANSNASNVSARTHPDGPRRVVVVTPEWDAVDLGADSTPFRVATPIMWVLMRIQVHDEPGDIDRVRALQDAVVVTGPRGGARAWPVLTRHAVESSGAAFLTALDAVVSINGVPAADEGLVNGFRFLGVGPGPDTVAELDDAVMRGVDAGFAEAMALLDASRSRLGRRTPSGWTKVLDKGAHGHNHVARAIMNFVGLGANVVDENCSYNTYVDAEGDPLSGEAGPYEIHFPVAPPAEAFWSVTLYDAATGFLHDAPDQVYSVGSSTRPDGTVVGPSRVVVGHHRPRSVEAGTRWLPAPLGPFFLVLRMYRPQPDALEERWTPPPVRSVQQNDGVAERCSA
ncbi:DUF1254 domain-containing protein [Rhodococcoides kroppenstedtii]|uniref:DUF1254 domain-containing protein n=1 Tax=Rhodococcoides kroppenstedtii TaxID=293050 RepID=UPI0036323896